jgi:hypothetical protein
LVREWFDRWVEAGEPTRFADLVKLIRASKEAA